MLHLTRFFSTGWFIALEHGDARVLVVGGLDVPRARAESRATAVHRLDEFTDSSLAGAASPEERNALMIQRVLGEYGVSEVTVPWQFPMGVADHLRARGVRMQPARDLPLRRRVKRPDEIAAIESTQRATEFAWAVGVDAIRSATVRTDRTLELDGDVMTAERLRSIVNGALLERNCQAPEAMIVAPGLQAADPHAEGSGPLRANEAIVMDIYPQHARQRYFADMSRTISKGEPSSAVCRMYEVVRTAQDAAIAALRPGVTGREVHELVEDIIFDAGFDTLREGQQHLRPDSSFRGFSHHLGHGVGLELHEAPVLGPGLGGSVPLKVGDVVAVEPGIYDPAVGGVRLEDLVVITPEGARNLTLAPRELVV